MFDRNELRTAGTANINGIDYVVLDDGSYNIVYTADELAWADEYVEAEDYSVWCQRVDAVDDEAIIAEVCREAGLAGAYTPGSCVWVEAAKDLSHLIGEEVETDDGTGRIVDITRTHVTVAWDGEVKTTEPVARLADWGFLGL